MRKSHIFMGVVALELGLLTLILVHALIVKCPEGPSVAERSALVERLGLTDLCLFSEASYTRNPTQTDLHTPFQDGPLSIEHFPSGSLMPPPPALHNRKTGGGKNG